VTLRRIAKDGTRTFYQGALADRIDRASRDEGGFLRKEDLRRYRAKERTSFAVSYRGYEIRTMPLLLPEAS
jgi:gamma-glutamyltranspeptidase/glutathione hydrolase